MKCFCSGLRAEVFVVTLVLAGCGPSTQMSTTTPSGIPDSWPFASGIRSAAGPHGMVASDAPLATEAGITILRRGGNAVDAAVATAFALAVVMPEAGNIGGGGFMVVRTADGTSAALDFREKAPRAASRTMYLDASGKQTDLSITGHLAAGVPGSVAGLFEAHRRFGRIPWADVLSSAIMLAERGFIVTPDFAESVRADSSRLARFPASAALFLPGGRPLTEGSLWKNPDLAAALTRIADKGPSGFYEGPTADLLVREMKRGGGLITHDDLRNYTAVWRTPINISYRSYRIVSMPPPSSGGTALALMANILEAYDLTHMGWHSPEATHLVVEAMRRAFADRNYFLGDPDLVPIPQDGLLSGAYAAERRATIDLSRATPSARVAHGEPHQIREGTHTTHFSVADGEGNAVALTTTVNLGFGSAVTVAGAGFLLNNEMDDFASKPGSPNVFGLVQGEANAIAPEKRILSSMSPTIVLNPDGTPYLITGASGGPRIITAVFQIISHVVDFNMDIVDAVTVPRFHHQHLPDTILVEAHGFPEGTLSTLRRMGHAVKETHHLAIAPSIIGLHGVWYGVADPRTGGAAQGF
jgi:gamma-glutamyltranspeptidase/glutathione hydrolase